MGTLSCGGILCPKCNEKTRVYESRNDGISVWRRRRCANGHRFTTLETQADVTHDEYKAIREVSKMRHR